MFYFLSGYFVKDEKLDTKGIKRILIPYCIWSVLWFAETTITGSQPVTTWKVLNTIFFGGAFFPLYFLVVLVELKLISPLIIKNIEHLNKNGKYAWYKDWMLLITPITLSILYAIQYITKSQPTIYAQIFPTWFIMYYAGCLVRKGTINTNTIQALLCVLIGIYMMNIESTYINNVLQVPFWAVTQLKFSSFFYSLALSVLFVSLHRKMDRGIIVRLGEYSFGIFLLHLPVKMIIEKLVNICLPNTHPLWQISVVVLSLMMCWIIIEISNKILPKWLNKSLGLK